jgi:hypothetical protein
MALVELRKCDNRIEASVLQSALEAAGVDAFLFDAEMSWVGGILPCRLMVDEGDLAQAQRVIDAAG